MGTKFLYKLVQKYYLYGILHEKKLKSLKIEGQL